MGPHRLLRPGAGRCDLWHYNPRTGDFDKVGSSHAGDRGRTGLRTRGKKGWSCYIRDIGWPVWITNVVYRIRVEQAGPGLTPSAPVPLLAPSG